MKTNLIQFRTGADNANPNNGIDPTSINNTGAVNGYYLGLREYKPTDVTLRAIAAKALGFEGVGFLNQRPSIIGNLHYIAKIPGIRSSYIDGILSNIVNRSNDASTLVLPNMINAIESMGNGNIFGYIGMYFGTASADCRMLPDGTKQKYSLNELMASYDLAYLEAISIVSYIQDYKSKRVYERVISMLSNLNHEQENDEKLKGMDYNGTNIYGLLTSANTMPTACSILARRAGENSEAFNKSMNDYLQMLKKVTVESSPMNNNNLPTFSMCTITMMAIMKKIADGQQLSQGDISFARDMTASSEGYMKMQTDLTQVLDFALMQNKIISNTGKCISSHVSKFKSAIETFSRCKNTKEYMSAEKKLRDMYTPESATFSIFNIDDLSAINRLQENAGRFLGSPQERTQAGGLDADVTIDKNQLVNDFKGYINNVMHPQLRPLITDEFMTDNRDEILELFSSVGLGKNTQISMSSMNLLKAAEGLSVMYGVDVRDNKALFNLVMATSLSAEGLAKYIAHMSGINYLTVVDAVGDAKSISANSHPFIKSDTGNFVRKDINLGGRTLNSLEIWTGAFSDMLTKFGLVHKLNNTNFNSVINVFPGSFKFGGYFYKHDDTDDVGALAVITRMIVNNPGLGAVTACKASVPSEWFDGGSLTYAQIPQANYIFDQLAKRKFNSYSELLNELQIKDPSNNNVMNANSSKSYRITHTHILDYITNRMSANTNGTKAATADMVASLEIAAIALSNAFNFEFM